MVWFADTSITLKSEIGDVLYCNDGDWVESCTALVEDMDGKLELLHWAEMRQMAMSHSSPGRDAASAPSLGLGKLISMFRTAHNSGSSASGSSKKGNDAPIGKTA